MLSELYAKFTPYEWLLSNRKGGYALGTAFLANLRKYHGLLIAGKEEGKRYHLLSSLEERVIFPSGLNFLLDTNFYRDTLYPEGYKLIKDYFFRPFPRFLFQCPYKGEPFLEKTLRFHRDRNVLLISYHNVSSYPYKLILRPKFTFRNHHEVSSASSWQGYALEINSQSAFLAKEDLALFLYTNMGKLKDEVLFYYGVYYPLEDLRGYPAFEDLFSPFYIEVELPPKKTLHLLFSDQALFDPWSVVKDIEERYRPYPLLNFGAHAFAEENLLAILEEMVEDFLLERDIIAGYPWFYCWGRDTFIGLPALFYLKEGKERALKIFEAYLGRMKKGLIPNVIGTPEETNYNSLDGTLWFALRIFDFIQFFEGEISSPIKGKLLSAIESIIEAFFEEGDLPFYVDKKDGFLEIPDSVPLALTWMDVVIDKKPLTPRYGKPIEISALWHNVLLLALSHLRENFIKKFKLQELVQRQRETFSRYFGEGAIADRLYQGNPVFETRPNFVIALGLPFTPASKEVLALADKIVREELLTSFGLRSLSPKHPAFKRKYFGNQYQRDLAYHHGTVWVWLLYPYSQMLAKLLTPEEYIQELQKLLFPFRNLLLSGKVGSLPELYDGDNPYYPKGAPAQFWSVAAIFLMEKELEKIRPGERV